uniref:NADH-ubiquinone oxidoreductase chain 6 n=1 Tax=Tenebrionoidea sp. 17 KM-2017 TaxID=2219472 RepID=A0A346RKI1_9CUCU|nr:NADH dehydrogenase subunit 6 [Tenebrionoidea sp. 17 KM-2017]
MFLMLTLTVVISLFSVSINHPLVLGLTLILQTILIALICGNMASSLWFSYILFLVMVGGMLVVFMYMTSIASNEKFKFSTPLTILTLTMLFLLLICLNNLPYTQELVSMMKCSYNNNTTLNMILLKYTSPPLNLLLIFLMMYLFIAMIAIVKITEFKQGPLRQNN